MNPPDHGGEAPFAGEQKKQVTWSAAVSMLGISPAPRRNPHWLRPMSGSFKSGLPRTAS